MEVFKVLDLETDTVLLYENKSFCKVIGIDEKNFNNRWRLKEGAGIVMKNRWYIKIITLCR